LGIVLSVCSVAFLVWSAVAGLDAAAELAGVLSFAIAVPTLYLAISEHQASHPDEVAATESGKIPARAASLPEGDEFARREPLDGRKPRPSVVHMTAEASGNSRVNQAGGDLTIHGE
jgi:hypothetical protein